MRDGVTTIVVVVLRLFVAPPCGKYNIKNNNNSVRENQIKED